MRSSGVVRFTRVRLGSLALGVDVFIRGRWIHSSLPWGSLGFLGSLKFALGVTGFMRGRWVHSGSSLVPMGSSGVVGFSGVRPGGRWIHWRSRWG